MLVYYCATIWTVEWTCNGQVDLSGPLPDYMSPSAWLVAQFSVLPDVGGVKTSRFVMFDRLEYVPPRHGTF